MTDFSTLSLRMALDAHTRIEQWIGQPDAPEPLLAALLDDFAPAFTMISVDGQRLPSGALPALFAGLRGSRPGLKIQIDELAVRHADAASALLTYCERHAWQGGATQRRASALFTAGADGQPRWAHLHETWA
ncbi:hypothetical protein [Achromobacter piechaudii]|uniref:DUF4440 domain-containing protein n=2 Tax=Achromobacter piechaudii TaxID=72556 RepID=A0ABM8KVZ2_9BURK|nr:hypothetical protein [Achromobacter piechaudii]EFF74893.1 hypothetical protein HMPREF0004_3774 [Achromobacter piechaudii ATCC 43553]CAB3691125.1 hypothetical protein LMG1873_02121 [Achromobacter piechaudii]CAB3861564.1 hypothetical protein LMG2828_02499 [Achromobacter piechaudii]CAB3949470.1 hypothetical protein LMG6103_02241 [Achromobacter piechaudii]